MLLPTNIATGRVTGQFLAGVVDGVDDDQDPDAIPASGFVTFTASVPYLPDPTATPNPATILTTSVVAVLDGEGYLCTPAEGTLEPSYRGVRLIATDDPDLSVSGWTWNATYSFSTVAGQKLAIPTHSFAVPSAGEVDLTTVVKVPSSTGIGTEQAEALAASAQAAAIQAAQDAATAAQAAVDAAAAAQVTDANISALVANPASDTAAEVTALVNTAAADKLGVDDAINTYQSQAALDAAAAAKVQAEGTSLNAAVKAIADNAAGPKLDAATAATTYAAKSVETTKLDVTAAADTYPGFSEVNTPTIRFDQFPVPLTDLTMLNSSVTNTSVVRVPGGTVYATFWGSDLNPYVAQMADGASTWQVVNLGTLPGNPLNAPAPADEHNALSIVVDGAGFIHISGNHHRVPLNYIRSAVANSITDGWESPGMIGIDELEVTYPQFIKTNTGDLLFFYRAGTSSDGDLMLNKYSTATKTWTRVGMVLKGHDWLTSADDMSAYPGKYIYDVSPGRLHMWWEWRDTTSIDSNVDFCYMQTTDNGATWQNAAGTTITLPVTPAETAVKVFAGGSGHVVGGACVDSSGNAYASLRMADGENRLYKRSGATITYTVMGTGMGHNSIVYTPDGKIYALYQGTDSYAYIKQVSPTVEAPVKMYPWTLPNWTPGMYTPDPGSYTLRIMISPVRKKAGGNYGGILTFDATAANIANMAAGRIALPKPRPVTPLVDPVRHVPGSYGMVPDMCYGPSGPRALSVSNANGTFRGYLITAARAGKIVEATINVTTAGAAGAKIRIVAYRTDGKVVAQSADIDVSTTGQKTIAFVANIGKNEQYVLGTLHHSSTGAGAILTAISGQHDSRIPFGSPTNYFTGVKSGWALASVPVPAVDTTPFLDPASGASQPSNDNTPLIVIKCGARPGDWLSGSE